jgi:uncharacterized lipoprotein YehR (DUF1307 family)
MKKSKIVLLSLVSVLVLSGCGKKELTCTMDSSTAGMTTKTTVDIKLDGSTLDSMNVALDVTIPDEYKDQKDQIIENLKASDESFKVSETKNGVKLTAGSDSKYFENFDLKDKKVDYDEVKEVFEKAGFECK